MIRDITGYQVSRDYEALADLMQAQSVVCTVRYGNTCRDVAHTVCDGRAFRISARGIGYVDAIGREDFIKQCTADDVEWLRPVAERLPQTGEAPCARMCEFQAVRHEFDRLKKENRMLSERLEVMTRTNAGHMDELQKAFDQVKQLAMELAESNKSISLLHKAMADAEQRGVAKSKEELAAVTEELHRYMFARKDLASVVKLTNERDMLRECALNLAELIEIPDPNCSCHIDGPCADCTDHAYARGVIKEFKALQGAQ